MNLRNFALCVFALALSTLAACGTAPGACSTNSDCPTGVCDTGSGFCVATCGNTVCTSDQTCVSGACVASTCTPGCTTGQTCEHESDGGFSCVQTDCFPACDPTYQQCNQTANPPVCVATTCHPACSSSDSCDQDAGGFVCEPATTGTLTITEPDAGVLVGVLNQLAVAATAHAPGGPTKVELFVRQGSADAGVEIDVGANGVYTGNITLASMGFTSAMATVTGTVFWAADGGELDAGSTNNVSITIDADPPSFGAATTDETFYSATATPAQTAHITLPINDVGGAGVSPSSVVLTANGHTYPADSTQYPDAGGDNGNYHFAVPTGDLNTSASFLGPISYSVAAADTVGNSSTFTTGTISLDNEAPTFDTISFDAGTWFGGDAGISIAVNAQDQASGSGLKPGSVAVTLSGGNSLTGPTVNGNTYTFTTIGSALQGVGQQGPVPFGFTATDNAGNVATIDGGSLLIDEEAPTLNTDGNSPLAWVARDAGTILVMFNADDGNGSGPKQTGPNDATLITALGPTFTPTSATCCDLGTTYSFGVPATTQTAGSEALIALSGNATDNAGNTSANIALGISLMIDDKAPTITATLASTAKFVDGSSVNWFKQSDSGEIEIDATVTDTGSGVNSASVKLMSGSTRIDDAGARVVSGNTYKLFIPRSGTAPLIVSGHEGALPFTVVATDTVGNAASISGPSIGIDGKGPSVSLTLSYPTAQTGCTGVDYCGHDGAHFWRKEANTVQLTFTSTDSGSGAVDTTAAASCVIGTGADANTCVVSSASGTAPVTYSFAADFSKATLTAPLATPTDGTGTSSVTVTAVDQVGNSTTSSATTVSVTRVKWIRKMAGKIDTFAGSPIVTSVPSQQIIFAGHDSNTSGPIASFGPDGSLLWRAGVLNPGASPTTLLSQVSANMAYSSLSKTLYVIPSGTPSTAYAFSVPSTTATFLPSYATIDGGSSVRLGGSPTIIVGPDQTEYVLVSDSGTSSTFRRLEQDTCVPFTGVATCGQVTSASATWTALTTPTTDGTNVYVGHDATFAKVPFTSGAIATPIDATAGSRVVGSIAAVNDLYFGTTSGHYDRFLIGAVGVNPTTDSTWTGGVTAVPTATVATNPIVTTSYVFGSFDALDDGHLYGFSVTNGSDVTNGFIYPATGTLGNISPVVLGADSTVYFTDDGNSELAAITATGSTVKSAWNFTGNGTATIASVTPEPSIDSSGTIYFGDSSGDIFALITDSSGPLAPTAGSTWPRVGFDNCNSNNSAFSCQ